MAARIDEIGALHAAYGKASHAAALESARRLDAQVTARPAELETQVFLADATDAHALQAGLVGRAIDVLIADLPYGRDSQWKRLQEEGGSSCSPLNQMLDALLAVTSTATILALSADKGPKLAHPAYQRVEHLRLGKRQVALLRPRHR
jgi:23S rRNA G2445 N2-methylase RlmL